MKRLLYFLVLCLASSLVWAATPNSLTFTAATTSANGQLIPVLTWATSPAASSCTASGHPSWTGTKAVSGSGVSLPAITLSGSYQLRLSCTWDGDTTARVSWTAPTQNTDGSALTNLASYTIYYGTSATALTQTQAISSPATLTYTFNGLAVGTWYFGVRARNSAGVESDLSNLAMKTLTASTSDTQTVALTINPIPNAPTGATVE